MSTLKVDTIRNEADGTAVEINRTTSDGTILDLQKDGTSVGSIGTSGGDAYIAGTTHGIKFDSIDASTMYIRPVNGTGSNVTAQIDLGQSGNVFRDAYLSGGLYFSPHSYPDNYLDDYEEGTWTSGLADQNSISIVDTTPTHNTYVKVGSVVHVQGHFEFSAADSSGYGIKITGLPFAAKNDASSAGSVILRKGSGRALQIYIGSGHTAIQFYTCDNTSAENWTQMAYNQVGALTAHFEITYRTNV